LYSIFEPLKNIRDSSFFITLSEHLETLEH